MGTRGRSRRGRKREQQGCSVEVTIAIIMVMAYGLYELERNHYNNIYNV